MWTLKKKISPLHTVSLEKDDLAEPEQTKELKQYFTEAASYEYITNLFSVNSHDLAVGTIEQEE